VGERVGERAGECVGLSLSLSFQCLRPSASLRAAGKKRLQYAYFRHLQNYNGHLQNYDGQNCARHLQNYDGPKIDVGYGPQYMDPQWEIMGKSWECTGRNHATLQNSNHETLHATEQSHNLATQQSGNLAT
jgi:hypothetical protein